MVPPEDASVIPAVLMVMVMVILVAVLLPYKLAASYMVVVVPYPLSVTVGLIPDIMISTLLSPTTSCPASELLGVVFTVARYSATLVRLLASVALYSVLVLP